MSRYMNFHTKSLVGMGVAATLLAGCATDQGTVAPPLPIPLASAQGYAQQKQQGINVTRQFVGLWANAKHSMQANFANCLAVSKSSCLLASIKISSHRLCKSIFRTLCKWTPAGSATTLRYGAAICSDLFPTAGDLLEAVY